MSEASPREGKAGGRVQCRAILYLFKNRTRGGSFAPRGARASLTPLKKKKRKKTKRKNKRKKTRNRRKRERALQPLLIVVSIYT